jgi:hypothetical protein
LSIGAERLESAELGDFSDMAVPTLTTIGFDADDTLWQNEHSIA